MEMEKKDLKLYQELRDLLPRPSDMVLSLLRKEIKEKKIVPPLITWKGILIDGYIRYDICKESGIPFECKEMEFDSMEEAKFFKIKTQLMQRNMTVFQRCEIVYSFENFIAEQVERQRCKAISEYRQNNETYAKRHWSENRDTGTILAAYAQTSRRMWFRAKALIERADEEVKELLRTDKLKIYTAYLRLQNGEPIIPKATSSEDDVDIDSDDFDSEVAFVMGKHVESESQFAKPIAMRTSTQAEDNDDLSIEKCEELEAVDEVDEVDEVDSNNKSDDWLPRACSTDGEKAEEPPIEYIAGFKPVTHQEPMEYFPHEPERNPSSFFYVKDYTRSALKNMIKEIKAAIYRLSDEDADKGGEILSMLEQAYNEARAIIEGEIKLHSSHKRN